jgi:hypothetical protein
MAEFVTRSGVVRTYDPDILTVRLAIRATKTQVLTDEDRSDLADALDSIERRLPPQRPGILGAHDLLQLLAAQLHTITYKTPAGDATAEMHCRQLLEVLEWGLQQLAAYLNVPQEQIRDHTIKPGPRRSRGGSRS